MTATTKTRRNSATGKPPMADHDDIDISASDEERIDQLRARVLKNLNLYGFDIMSAEIPFIDKGFVRHRHCLVIVPLQPRQQATS